MANGLFTLKQQVESLRQGAWSGYIAPTWVEYLVVAGGGGGGTCGGGAGAGGLLTGIVTVAAGASYSVTIGTGGAGSTSYLSAGVSGVNSVFGSISSLGGGGAGSSASGGSPYYASGVSGGSGGGMGANAVLGGTGGQGTSGQGNNGGLNAFAVSAGSPNYGAGGGGGAGTKGLNGGTTFGGNGGAGIASAISGSVVTYAGGGGGGSQGGTAGTGGVGGGGSGTPNDTTGSAGGGNTGGGGGGGGYTSTNGSGGNGGSGIVVVRYPGNVQFFTGGTLSYANGHIVHTFFATGTLAPTTPTVYIDTPYQISRSLRFNSADTAILGRTAAGATNRKTWTWSGWVKRGSLGTTQIFFVAGVDGSNYTNMYFSGTVTDNLEIYNYTGGVTVGYHYTTSVFRDTSAWYHIVYSVDTTQSAFADRVKIYVNNVLQPVTVNTTFASSVDTWINSANQHYLGRNGPGNASQYFDGYMTEVHLVDGQALTPSAFGYTNPATGVWAPHKFVGTYGTNGFYLKFADNSNTTAGTLGADSSGNGNNWTPTGFSVSVGVGNDSLVDTPTQYGTDTGVGGEVRGNYCTLNPLYKNGAGTPAITNGNLDMLAGGTGDSYFGGTFSVSSGKWYYECLVNSVASSGGTGLIIGICKTSAPNGTNVGGYRNTSEIYNLDGTTQTAGTTYATGNTIGVAIDIDAGTVQFYKNNVAQGATPSFTFTAGTEIFVRGRSDGENPSVTFNFGQRAFTYTAPSGFKALNTQNLPTPAVGGSAATLASKFFAPVTYTGNAPSSKSIAVGFKPDFVWVKNRSNAGGYYHGLFDSVRGANKVLVSNITATEDATITQQLNSFDSGGFTVGTNSDGGNYTNLSENTYVAWNWKAGSTAVTNTSGTISSQVSANPTAGFSIVSWTGSTSTSSQTFGHGLGVTPSVVILKNRNLVDNWFVYFSGITSVDQYLRLNTTAAVITSGSNVWGAGMTSTLVGIRPGTFAATTSDNIIMYCFAPVAGYSAFGSYTGNGSTNGPFVYTGFRPAYVMIKRSDSTDGGEWKIHDATRTPFNWTCNVLFAGDAYAENTTENQATYGVDMLSNGFKIRASHSSHNTSTASYIYMAFASHPFKHSLAR